MDKIFIGYMHCEPFQIVAMSIYENKNASFVHLWNINPAEIIEYSIQ